MPDIIDLTPRRNSISRDTNSLSSSGNVPVSSPMPVDAWDNTPGHTGDFGVANARLTNEISNRMSPHGDLILQWRGKPTWHCHWFPMMATQPGGDRVNNLYAERGPLHKYDVAFGRRSRDYELQHNAIAHDADEKKYSWWGHCNNASEVACLLEEPKYAVSYNGITFTPHDIAGLLVKVSQSLISRVDYRGQRYNGPSDNPSDPAPYDFLEKVLRRWGQSDQTPFILDVDRKEQVWNYPYDQGKVYESEEAPEDFDASRLPNGGIIKFYRAELKGTGFEDQERTYQFWIQYDYMGNPVRNAWIQGEDEKINPDFAWRAHPRGDLTKLSGWQTVETEQNNPIVRAEDIYRLYRASIGQPAINDLRS